MSTSLRRYGFWLSGVTPPTEQSSANSNSLHDNIEVSSSLDINPARSSSVSACDSTTLSGSGNSGSSHITSGKPITHPFFGTASPQRSDFSQKTQTQHPDSSPPEPHLCRLAPIRVGFQEPILEPLAPKSPPQI